MSAGHTPGPWIANKGISESDEMRCGVSAVRGDLQYLVATIENGAPGDYCDTEFANARLIAAAPKLLEQLASAALALDEASKLLASSGLPGVGNIMSAHAARARAAIAEATTP